MSETIVVVGASLAGTRAVEALRDEGHSGSIVMVGDESSMPYDRPPLSKQVLLGEWAEDEVQLMPAEDWSDLEVEVRLGSPAVGLDVAAHHVDLADGSRVGYDGLIVATGARARTLGGPRHDRVHVLRTLQDAVRLRAALEQGGCRLGIVGGGFIGSEVAHAARTLGCAVTVLERGAGPMAQVLGEQVALSLAGLQAAHGVELVVEARVLGVRPAADGERVAVDLGDGSALEFDHVLVCIGSQPNVEWLTDPSLDVDGGLVCDDRLFAAPDVVGAGDVVRVRGADGVVGRRIEHWTDAARQAETAAANLIAGAGAAIPFAGVPYVWSDQFGVRIEVIGDPTRGAVEDLVPGGDHDRGSLLARYTRAGSTAAVVTVAMPGVAMSLRRRVHDLEALAAVRPADLAVPTPTGE